MASGSASPPAFLSISFISFLLRVSTKSCCPSLPSPFAAFFLRPAQIACFGLEVQETQKTAQQEKTGKMREEKQDTLSIIFILLCSLLGSASRVQVAVRLRCELAYDINAQAANSRGKLALGHQQAVSRPCPTCFRVAHLQRENRPSKRLRSAGAASAAEESRLCQPQEAKAASQLAGDFSGCRAEAPLPCIFRRGTGNPPSRVQTLLGEAPEGRGETAKPGATTEPAARQKKCMRPQIEEAERRRMSHSRWWGSTNCGWQVVSAI